MSYKQAKVRKGGDEEEAFYLAEEYKSEDELFYPPIAPLGKSLPAGQQPAAAANALPADAKQVNEPQTLDDTA